MSFDWLGMAGKYSEELFALRHMRGSADLLRRRERIVRRSAVKLLPFRENCDIIYR